MWVHLHYVPKWKLLSIGCVLQDLCNNLPVVVRPYCKLILCACDCALLF